MLVRTASDPMSLAGAIQRELRDIEPTVAIENVKTLEEVRRNSIAARMFAMRVLVAFSIVACVLTFVGILGAISPCALFSPFGRCFSALPLLIWQR